MTWQIIVSALTGGLAGAILSHYFIVWREKGGRRRAFYTFMARLIAEVRDTGDDGVSHYMANRSSVLSKCAEIECDIAADKRYGFECACREYCDLQKRESQLPLAHLVKMAEDMGHYKSPPKDDRTIKQKMIDALQKLKDCAG